jgi:hypothetical protein
VCIFYFVLVWVIFWYSCLHSMGWDYILSSMRYSARSRKHRRTLLTQLLTCNLNIYFLFIT